MLNFFYNIQSRMQGYLLTAVVALLAIVCHECAHGWVSCKLGDPTAKNAGRLTLNPLTIFVKVNATQLLLPVAFTLKINTTFKKYQKYLWWVDK